MMEENLNLETYNTLISEQEKNVEEDLELAFVLARNYLKRGRYYAEQENFQEATDDFTMALSFFHKLDQAGKISNYNEIALTYVVRGMTFLQEEKYWKAVKDLTTAITLQEQQMARDEDPNLLADLVASYRNRAIIHLNMKKHNKAIKDYEKGIKIIEKAQEKIPDYEANELATMYIGRGTAYISSFKYQQAIEDLSKSIAIQTDLREKQKLISIGSLILAYRSRFIAYKQSHHNLEAQQDSVIIENLLQEENH